MGRKAVKMAEEKKNWLGPYIPQGNILREVVQQIKLLYNLMLDRRVNLLAKLIFFHGTDIANGKSGQSNLASDPNQRAV